jgi:hypothetical protein
VMTGQQLAEVGSKADHANREIDASENRYRERAFRGSTSAPLSQTRATAQSSRTPQVLGRLTGAAPMMASL